MRVIEKSEIMARIDFLEKSCEKFIAGQSQGFPSALYSVLRDLTEILSGDARLVITTPIQKRKG